VVLMGYDAEKRYWIVKNSYGRHWGLDGYIYISMDDVFSAFGHELYTVSVPNIQFDPDWVELFPDSSKLTKSSSLKLQKLVEELTACCGDPEALQRLNPISLEVQILDIQGNVMPVDQLPDVEPVLYVNGEESITFAFNKKKQSFSGTFVWVDLPFQPVNMFQVRATWKKSIDAAAKELGVHDLVIPQKFEVERTNNQTLKRNVYLYKDQDAYTGSLDISPHRYYRIRTGCQAMEFVLRINPPASLNISPPPNFTLTDHIIAR